MRLKLWGTHTWSTRQFWPRNVIKEVEVKRRREIAPHPGYQPLWVIVKLAPGYTFEVGLLLSRRERYLLGRITSTGRSLRITGRKSLTKDSSKMKIETLCQRYKVQELNKIVSISSVACCLVQLCTKWIKLQIIKFIALNLLLRSGQFTTHRTWVETIDWQNTDNELLVPVFSLWKCSWNGIIMFNLRTLFARNCDVQWYIKILFLVTESTIQICF